MKIHYQKPVLFCAFHFFGILADLIEINIAIGSNFLILFVKNNA
jgi:hypothetical protein